MDDPQTRRPAPQALPRPVGGVLATGNYRKIFPDNSVGALAARPAWALQPVGRVEAEKLY